MGNIVEESDQNQLIERLLDILFAPDNLVAREAARQEYRGKSYHELRTLEKSYED